MSDAENRFAESDRLQKAIDENWKLVKEAHAENAKLTKEYHEALERELGPALPVLQKMEWKLDLFFDMNMLLADSEGDLRLLAMPRRSQEVLKMFAPSSRERIVCEGVMAENSGGVIYLKLDLGSLVENVEWCLANDINVVSSTTDEKVKTIFDCQDKINAMNRLLKHEEEEA